MTHDDKNQTDMRDETSEEEPTRRKGGRSSGVADESPDDQDEMDREEN